LAYLDDLIARVSEPALRDALAREVAKLKSRTNFGIVFERHIPERIAVPPTTLTAGATVVLRNDPPPAPELRVETVSEGLARLTAHDGQQRDAPLSDLLVLQNLGEPFYPGLVPLGSIERAPGAASHAVIEGENHHGLQLLTFLIPQSVDCIYIDPPYNTGATAWKYNNRYVDSNDVWRHSKWLSMMDRRLRLAKRLLKPDGVLVVTIDQNELHHLGLLLEERFPEARRQVVTLCINPGGASGGGGLSRVEEYAVFCFFGDAEPCPTKDDMLLTGAEDDVVHTGAQGIRWEWLLRGGNAWYRSSRPNLCYPILLDPDGTRIVSVGPPAKDEDAKLQTEIDGCPVAWPLRRDGKLGIWRVDAARLRWLTERGYAFVSARDAARGTWTIKYLMEGTVDAIEAGVIEVTGYGDRGEVHVQVSERKGKVAKTMWNRGRHVAGGAGGTHMLNALLGERNLFPFPKSVYAVRDCLEVAIGSRKDALILDFFAGSGTTLHATCLLNAEDGGSRRCLLVTNNEVEAATAARLVAQGHYPGAPAYEAHGIFEAVTRPRCEAVVSGQRPDGSLVPGDHLGGRPLAEGFQTNVFFFRLDYLDRDRVELGREYAAIVPALWIMAGARGGWDADVAPDAAWSIPEQGSYGALFHEGRIREFRDALEARSSVRRVFLVTDSREAYAEMCELLGGRWPTSMLYRDYLRNFRIEPTELL
jgi:adenine-specific DNA-methyltransferase